MDDPYQAYRVRAEAENEIIQPYDPSTNSDPLATSVLGVAT